MPALQGQMIWDDSYLIHDNPFIKSPIFLIEIFRHYLWLDAFSQHYRPLQNLSYMVDYFFWNNDLYGFHLTNVLLHVGSGILLYLLLQRLFISIQPAKTNQAANSTWSIAAFFTALLWVVHPVHSAAVDYISGRADSLAFLFASAGWLVFLSAHNESRALARRLLYALAAISGLLSLCSREIACIWFVLFILHLLIFDKWRSPKFRATTVICALCIVGIYAGLRQLPGTRASMGGSNDWPIPMRSVLMFRALGDYGRLMLFPANLHMERTIINPERYFENSQTQESVTTEYLSIFGLVILIGLVLAAKWPGPGCRLRIFGGSWFVLAFLPISNIVDLNATVAEHWLYLPSVGFLIFLAGCILEIPRRFHTAAVVCASCAAVALGVRSFTRSSDWLTDQIFYEHTLTAGGSSARVLCNLGQIYAAHEQYAKAETIFRKLLARSPDYPLARTNLAEIFAREGKTKEAEQLLASTAQVAEQTKKDYPRTWIAGLNLALGRHKAKDDKAALSIAEKMRHDYPGVWEIIRFEAEVLRETQGPKAALPLVESFTHNYWWHHDAALALGRLYAQIGDDAKADAALRHASWLDLHDAQALNAMAEMRLRQNQLDQALHLQRRAIARQPDELRQYLLLSSILEKMGHGEEARASIAKMDQLQAFAKSQPVVN